MAKTAIDPSNDPGAPFISHLVELRDRLKWSLIVVLGLFIVLLPFANPLYELLAKPLMASLPEGNSMIATQPHGTFLVPLKFAFAVSVGVAIPFLLFQLWAFVAPGLYSSEKRLAYPILVSSTVLFYLGVLFCYFVVFPIIFAFFASMTPEGVAMMTEINEYLGFVLKLFFAFGLAFEVPVATVLLVAIGATTPQSLREKRPYVIVGAFVVGMLMTPPDAFSQTLLAVPVWLLFELGVFASTYVYKPDPEEDIGNDAASVESKSQES